MLLLAAGYAPVYPQTPLDDPSLEHVRTALGHILAGHLPYPAIVVDAGHDLVLANDAFGLLTEGVAEHLLRPPVNVLRLSLHPEGLAPRIVNLAQWARHILDRIPHDDLYDDCPATCRTPPRGPTTWVSPPPSGCARRSASCG